MKRSRGKSLNQEMNLTNMIDVVFAILIVFLISAPLMSQGIKVDLPNAEAPTLEQKKMLKVSINKEEKIFVEEMEVNINDFGEIFKSLWKDDVPVVINADESVHYGIVMKVVSLVQVAGVKQLGFLTLDKDEKKYEKKLTQKRKR
ncbi:MAG: biopolymer transporter ExbD [Fibromonadaceae bacterium]|jgi:biopolymer transport protein ExbD/biopolymer transport protein TolR|nr:biopolymer transporter ExbD [Fibromonadaceae bacterium]